MRLGLELWRDVRRALPGSQARRHPFTWSRGVEPQPNPAIVRETRQSLLRLIPSLGSVDIQRAWAGIIDATPDAVPVLGEVPSVRGFIFATGFSGHGFALGPGAGKVIAELILDGKPSVDLTPLRYTRFRERDTADWTLTI